MQKATQISPHLLVEYMKNHKFSHQYLPISEKNSNFARKVESKFLSQNGKYYYSRYRIKL